MLHFMTCRRMCPPITCWIVINVIYRPKATTLYALNVPQGPPQVVRYDDGTGDELPVPLGTTVCEYAMTGRLSTES